MKGGKGDRGLRGMITIDPRCALWEMKRKNVNTYYVPNYRTESLKKTTRSQGEHARSNAHRTPKSNKNGTKIINVNVTHRFEVNQLQQQQRW